MINWQPLWLSLRLASITTAILLVIAVPLGYWLAYSRQRWRIAVEAIISLPMVLPPTVLGFYLLVAFSPSRGFGRFLDHYLDLRLVFTFPGLVIASLLYSLPFTINPIVAGFRGLSSDLTEASRTLGKSDGTTLFRIHAAYIRPSPDYRRSVLSFALPLKFRRRNDDRRQHSRPDKGRLRRHL